MSLAPHMRLGRYRILSPLGVGGMGEVYRAHDGRLGRFVAIKVLPDHLQNTPEVRQRFEREARTVSGLNHPHICVLHDIDREGDVSYMVLELLEGTTLAERLARGPLPPREVAKVGAQIASALGRAHRAGVVHRDLKPGNIMITKSGAKLMDFGVARPTGGSIQEPAPASASVPAGSRSPDGPITSDGALVGTVRYIAPEQIAGRAADVRSDIWGLGCVLYEMATGRPAFDGGTSTSIVSAILYEQPRRMTELAPRVPHELERLVLQCLAKDPDERWQSADDLVHGLSWAERTIGGRQEASVRVRGRRLLPAALTVAALIFMALVGWQATRTVANRPSFTPLTYEPLLVLGAAFAPDGRSVVVSASKAGEAPCIYVKRPEGPTFEPVGVPGMELLSVSTQGELAVLVGIDRLRPGNVGTLARMPMSGAGPREILRNVRSADWSPDGEALAVIHDVGGQSWLEYPIGHRLRGTGGWMSHVRISPDGDRIAFFAHPWLEDNRGAVHVVNRDGRTEVLTEDFYSLEGLAWSANGREVLFSASDGNSPAKVYAVTLRGRIRIALESAGGQTIQDVNPEGHWLTTRDDHRSRLIVCRPKWDEPRDMSWLGESGDGSLSPDGKTIVFTEYGPMAGPYYAVCVRGVDGSPPARLGEGMAFRMSPDGKWVLAGVASRPAKLLAYSYGPGPTRRLDGGRFDSFRMAWWTPGGDSIVFVGSEQGRAQRFYVQGFESGPPRPVTPEGVVVGVPSWDSPEIMAIDPDGHYAIYSWRGAEPRRVPFLRPEDRVAGWSGSRRAVILTDHPFDVPLRMERLDLDTGRRTPCFSITPPAREGLLNIAFFWVASDEKSYSFTVEQLLSTVFLVKVAA